FAPTIGQERTYGTIDTYTQGTTVLYSFDPPRTFGLMDSQPFQYGYDLGGGYQFHLHGPDRNTLTFGSLEFRNEPIRSFNGYESSMLDPILNNNFKKFP
ncbi:MAG: hypothetical protein AABX52_01030, partial [Nanoarchaeota archaeon]